MQRIAEFLRGLPSIGGLHFERFHDRRVKLGTQRSLRVEGEGRHAGLVDDDLHGIEGNVNQQTQHLIQNHTDGPDV